MTIRAVCRASVACSLLVCAAAFAGAQAPAGAAKLTAAQASESLAVLRTLDNTVRANPKDAGAFFHRGMLAWILSERQRVGPSVPGLNRITLMTTAEQSLRLAADLEPDNAYYRLMVGRSLLNSGVSVSRSASYKVFDDALAIARKGGEPYVHSETAVESGRVYWRRYDGLANRWMRVGDGGACEEFTGVMPSTIITANNRESTSRPKASVIMREELAQCAIPDNGASGEADYLKAEQLFREAFQAQPANQRAYRQLAMLLVERNRWTEVGSLARDRLQNAPWDAWAWLTLGLAMHRQKADPWKTVAAFDSAFTMLTPEDRQRLNRLERIFTPKDSLKLGQLDPAHRLAMHRLYFLTATPLWSQQFDEPDIEFLARVTYAELRWTVEEMGVRGADTDRGDVYIRYGAPDLVVGLRGGDDPMNPIYTKWTYDAGLVFTFVGQPTFATAAIPAEFQADFAEMVSQMPVRWVKPIPFTVDSMPVQIARFRARDSVDVMVAALPPVAAIAQSADAGGAVRSDLWFLAGGTVSVLHDSLLPTPAGVRKATYRLAPRSYLMRTEASADGSLHAARASVVVGADSSESTGFPTRGFGMSDVLIAATADDKTGTARRWNELDIAPVVGSVAPNREISLVWENYDLAMKDGGARYSVAITLRRDTTGTSKGARVAAQITGALARSVGVDRGDDRVTLTFERNVPHAAILLDNVALTLAATPPGTYRLTVLITDLTNDHKHARTTTLTIRE